MPEIALNFDEIPDRVPPVDTGSYELEIYKEPVMKENDDKSALIVTFNFKVISLADGGATPMKDRVLSDRITISSDPNDFGNVRLGNLRKCFDIPKNSTGGISTEACVGKRGKTKVEQTIGKDGTKYVGQTFSNVKEYFFQKQS